MRTLIILVVTLLSITSYADQNISNNRDYLTPPEIESCEVPDFYPTPTHFAGINGRLIKPLREAAADTGVITDLVEATKYRIRGQDDWAQAFADLAVTGSLAMESFKRVHATPEQRDRTIIFRIKNDPEFKDRPESEIKLALSAVLDRAYAVANAIAFGENPARKNLGWIAVSGEDDMPSRPVNIPSSKYIQRNIDVNINGQKVVTRYIVAQTLYGPSQNPPANPGRTLPQLKELNINSDAKILLYVHDLGSRLEEATHMIAALEEYSKAHNENWVVIAMDLPTSGHATKLNHFDISPIEAIGHATKLGFDAGGTQNTPVLNFIEKFIVSFVDALDGKIPVKDNIQALVGGGLGGSLALRLGRRSDLPWLQNIVAWSPDSVWYGFADGSNPFKNFAVATYWKHAGGDTTKIDEGTTSRDEYFSHIFQDSLSMGPVTIIRPQPERWWSNTWPCFSKARAELKMQQAEIYNSNFRLWNWRLEAEELIYSHSYAPDIDEPRYFSNSVRTLLACGLVDNFMFTRVCGRVQAMSRYMEKTPGRAIFLWNTGHAIHNERPKFLVEKIMEFLN